MDVHDHERHRLIALALAVGVLVCLHELVNGIKDSIPSALVIPIVLDKPLSGPRDNMQHLRLVADQLDVFAQLDRHAVQIPSLARLDEINGQRWATQLMQRFDVSRYKWNAVRPQPVYDFRSKARVGNYDVNMHLAKSS